MKKTYKYLLGFGLVVLASMTATSCIDETEPTQVATTKQVGKSSSATKALLMAMPAYFNHYPDYGVNDTPRHWSFAYGSMMFIRDCETGDCAMPPLGYDHFDYFYTDRYMGNSYVFCQYLWNYYYSFVMTANNLIGSIHPSSAADQQKGYLGAGYAFRAMLYLDMARCFEFLPNDATSATTDEGNDVTNYTVPIVTDSTSEEAARNNPRVKRDVMAKFIQGDLDKAEQMIPKLDITDRTLPHLDCVYGLKARLYMWLEDYPDAEKYARMAINEAANEGVSVMSKDDCLNTTTGFNDISKWMWGSQMTSEDDLVKTGIINWVSWASSENKFGYGGTGAGVFRMIDAKMYSRIDDNDFRKLEFIAPAGSKLSGKEPLIDESQRSEIPAYASIKFRPNKGDINTSSVGAASAFPVMRVEEMYFIEAEAAAHQDPERGKELLVNFMTKYRDPQYVCKANNKADIIDEIVFQKRVELWGEGQSFFDIKRLNMSVTRGYEGTDHEDLARFNTNGRPAWMNWCIVKNEENNNSALKGWGNPDPSDKYTPWAGK